MGSLLYGPQERPIHIEDRALAHLKIVMIQKLRQREGFTFAWTTRATGASADSTIWLNPSMPLQFVFEGSEPRELNRAWLQVLAETGSRGEVRLLDEPK